jgi:hypothetical protein
MKVRAQVGSQVPLIIFSLFMLVICAGVYYERNLSSPEPPIGPEPPHYVFFMGTGRAITETEERMRAEAESMANQLWDQGYALRLGVAGMGGRMLAFERRGDACGSQ